MGATALQLLTDRIEGGPSHPNRQVILDAHLVVRQSDRAETMKGGEEESTVRVSSLLRTMRKPMKEGIGMSRFRLSAAILIAVVCILGVVTAVSAAPITVGAILFGRDSFFENIQNGMEKAAKDAGVKLLVSVHDHDIAKETEFIEDYVARGVQAIVITPESTTASVPAIKKAFEAGVKIVCFNTSINPDDAKKYVSAFYETDQASLGYQTGQYLAKWLSTHIKGVVNVGILQCDRFEACQRRGEGFRKALNEAKVNWKEAANQEGSCLTRDRPSRRTSCRRTTTSTFSGRKTRGGTVGEVIAVRTMNLTGKVFVSAPTSAPSSPTSCWTKTTCSRPSPGNPPRKWAACPSRPRCPWSTAARSTTTMSSRTRSSHATIRAP